MLRHGELKHDCRNNRNNTSQIIKQMNEAIVYKHDVGKSFRNWIHIQFVTGELKHVVNIVVKHDSQSDFNNAMQ